MASLKKLFPISAGWLHATLTLKPGGSPITQEQFRQITGKHAEIVHFHQTDKKLIAVYREPDFAARMARASA